MRRLVCFLRVHRRSSVANRGDAKNTSSNSRDLVQPSILTLGLELVGAQRTGPMTVRDIRSGVVKCRDAAQALP
jgi:hypothetical protein